MSSSLTFRDFYRMPALWITLVLFLGFILSPGVADVAAIKTDAGGMGAGGKIIRVITVMLAAIFAFLSLYRSGTLSKLVAGNLALIFIFSALAYMSVVFSELITMTIYKSSELIVALLIAATLYGRSSSYSDSKKYLTGLFWIYFVTVIGVFLQLLYYGPGEYKQVHSTPFITFMLSSKHPPMAANSLGLLGALVAMFGIYYFYKTGNKRKYYTIIGFIIGSLGLVALVLSYTRSALALFVLAGGMFLYFNRKYVLLMLAVSCMIILLVFGATRDMVESHMRRGDSDQNLETLSSRSIFWNHILEKDSVRLIVGDGYATGTLFQSYGEGGGSIFKARNAHNSLLEIINSTGIFGALVWFALVVRINMQLILHLVRTKKRIDDEYLFHIFITTVFVLCSLRSVMNTTFVYLDYFLPMFFAIAVYADSLKTKRSQLLSESNGPATSPYAEDATDNEKDQVEKLPILSYKRNS